MAASVDNVNLGMAAIVFGSSTIGHTSGTVDCNFSVDVKEKTVSKFGSSPVGAWRVGQRLEVKALVAESDLPHLLEAISGATLVTGATKNEINVGGPAGAEITPAVLTLTPIGDANQVWTIYKAIVISSPSIAYSNEDQTMYEITWLALIDESRAEGDQLFAIGTSD